MNKTLEVQVNMGHKNRSRNSRSAELDRLRDVERYQGTSLIFDNSLVSRGVKAFVKVHYFQLFSLVSLCSLHVFNNTTQYI